MSPAERWTRSPGTRVSNLWTRVRSRVGIVLLETMVALRRRARPRREVAQTSALAPHPGGRGGVASPPATDYRLAAEGARSDRARVSSSAFVHNVPHGPADAHAMQRQLTVQRLRNPCRQLHPRCCHGRPCQTRLRSTGDNAATLSRLESAPRRRGASARGAASRGEAGASSRAPERAVRTGARARRA
jgi:hypothetical protein